MVAREPQITRAELSRRVASRLGWKDCHGRPKAMSCRGALLKLGRRGVIALPAPRTKIKRGAVCAPALPVAASVVRGPLAELGELTVELVQGPRNPAAQHWKALITLAEKPEISIVNPDSDSQHQAVCKGSPRC